MTKIALAEIRERLAKILSDTGRFASEEVVILVDDFLEGDLRNKKTHGLNQVPSFLADLTSRPAAKVMNESASSLFVDAGGDIGVLQSIEMAKNLIQKASKQGVAVGYIRNAKPILRPSFVTDFIAKHDMVGLVMNSGGLPITSHPNGVEPLIGTNPIGFSIPKDDGALSADMATSKRAWGEVTKARRLGDDLPYDSYKDKQGVITYNPYEAYSAIPAGDYKGFALGTFVEIMCGSFLGMDIGGSRDENAHRLHSRGVMIFVFDPAFTVGKDDFKAANTKFVSSVKQVDDKSTILMPGERSERAKWSHLADDFLDIDNALWDEILKWERE